MTPGRQYTFDAVRQLLWQSKLLLLGPAVVLALLAAVYVSRIPNLYRASATVLVQPQLVPQNVVRSTVTQDIDDQLRSLSERVLAPEALANLATELSLNPAAVGRLSREDLGRAIRSRTAIEIVRADAFRVSFVHNDGALAARVANRLARGYVEAALDNRAGLAEETDQFLDAQLQGTRERLAEQEQKLEQYRRAYSGQLPSQLSSNLQVLQNAQVQLRSVAEALSAERERKLKLEQALSSLITDRENAAAAETDVSIDATFDPLKDDALPARGREALRALPSVRSRLRTMELQLKPDHPDIVRLKRVIVELERRVEADRASRPAVTSNDGERSENLDQLRTQLATVESRVVEREIEEQELRSVIARYQQRVELVPTRETELTTLMRDYDTLRESYQGLLTKKEETHMAADLERRRVGETFKVAESAGVPLSPFYPQRRRTVVLAALLGIGLGFVVAAWREFQDATLRSEAEVLAGLNLPVVALIPVIDTPYSRQALRGQWVWLGCAGLVVSAAVILYFRLNGGR